MKIIEVRTKKDWQLFHRTAHQVYRNDPNWIAPLEREVEGIFNPAINKTLDDGEFKCFVLFDNQNQPAGRIAAFADHRRNREQPFPVGGIGFFECVPNEDFAFSLFETAETYLKSLGVKAVDGPINFGERDRFWGLLVNGFFPPLYQENYNPPYYESYFLKWGFRPFEQILTFGGPSRLIPFQRISAIAKRLKERNQMEIKILDYNDLEAFSRDFCVVYNASFADYAHFKPLTAELVMKFMREAKPVADPNLACIAYFEGQPAGFIALYPDINPFLRHAKGKLNLWNTLVFLFKNKTAKTFNAKGMGFGIHPEYQSKGIFALLLDFLCSERNLKRYPHMYLAGIRTHNHEIISIYSKMQVKVNRVHVAYRKLLDDGLPFEPFEFQEIAPIVEPV